MGPLTFSNPYIEQVPCRRKFLNLSDVTSSNNILLFTTYTSFVYHVQYPVEHHQFFVAQPKSATKKISILMTRISPATINPPPTATSCCSVTHMLPSIFVGMAVAVTCLVAMMVVVVVVVVVVAWGWPGWWLWG